MIMDIGKTINLLLEQLAIDVLESKACGKTMHMTELATGNKPPKDVNQAYGIITVFRCFFEEHPIFGNGYNLYSNIGIDAKDNITIIFTIKW